MGIRCGARRENAFGVDQGTPEPGRQAIAEDFGDLLAASQTLSIRHEETGEVAPAMRFDTAAPVGPTRR